MKILQLKLKPNARTRLLSEQADGSWLAQVKAAPVDGKANEEVIRLVAEHFGVRRAQVSIRSGGSGRRKLMQIDDG